MSSVILKKIANFFKMRAPAEKFLLYHKLAYSAPVSSYTKIVQTFKIHKEEEDGLCWNEPMPRTPKLCFRAASRRDTEHERYHPELEEELKECLFCLRRNEMMFDLEVDTDLIEQRIYERQALLCRYRYLLARARELGLHTVLTKYQPAGQV